MEPGEHIYTWWGISTEIHHDVDLFPFLLVLIVLLGLLLFYSPQTMESGELKLGDHIYSWRGIGTEIYHGIYVGDGMVIHFTRDYQRMLDGVVSSTVDQFRSGGKLYIFEYDVNPVIFLAKPGGNTTASADPTEHVLHRARFLLKNSSPDYHPCIKNCYDFAIYCKTGLIVSPGLDVVIYWPGALNWLYVILNVFYFIDQGTPAGFTALAATPLSIYSACRLAFDIRDHPNFIKVEVERFAQVETLAFHILGFRRILYLFKLVLVASICLSISSALGMWSKTRPLVWGVVIIKFLYWPLFHRTFEFRWVFSNKLRRNQLKCGDHIYTWRNWYSYAHHGIYVDEEKVIHLTRGGGPILSSLSPRYNQSMSHGPGRVATCSIDTFLSGGKIYRFEYDVDLAFFIAKSRGGTCTLAHSDAPGLVLNRASFLVGRSFGGYNLISNNCEDFALYCKTGFLVRRIHALGRSGQIISIIAVICTLISFPYSSLPTSIGDFVGGLAVGYVLYSFCRLFSDTRFRPDAYSVGVQELDAFDGSRNLFLTLLIKFIPGIILLGTLWFVQQRWGIRSQNSLEDWMLKEIVISFLLFCLLGI